MSARPGGAGQGCAARSGALIEGRKSLAWTGEPSIGRGLKSTCPPVSRVITAPTGNALEREAIRLLVWKAALP